MVTGGMGAVDSSGLPSTVSGPAEVFLRLLDSQRHLVIFPLIIRAQIC